MSIYISGVEMPKKDSIVILRIWGYGDVERFEGYHSYLLNGVKASNVPNHGRLIDADALIGLLGIMGDKCDNPVVWEQMRYIVEDVPTIVPADKDGE